MDASKAFDCVCHLTLYNKLLQRNLPPIIVRLLFSWYSDQKSSVLRNNSLSQKFSVSNGVRQGGVLSPILFIVYIDDLLTRLELQAAGCYWSHYFVGASGYADDIVLLAPSASALRMMLNTCCQFAKDHNLLLMQQKLNLSASRLLAPLLFSLQHQYLSSKVKLLIANRAWHLGHILRSDLCDTKSSN